MKTKRISMQKQGRSSLIIRQKPQSCIGARSKLQKEKKGIRMTGSERQNDEKYQETDVSEGGDHEKEASSSSAEIRIAELEKQLAEAKDRILREMADAENTRRRAQKDREETAKYATAAFAKEIVAISDNFRRALESAPSEISDPVVKNLVAGVDATERQLLATLERFGIKQINPLGQVFDPHFHRVMMEVDATDQPAGTVMQVLQIGYMIHDRLLREALVAVAKGVPTDTPRIDTSA
jgi:molecular chaperone GrpE